MLSIVLATHNEELNLKKCLQAIKIVADEIVIVDGESSDSTLAIAQSFSAKIISTTNKQNFHINKQMAIDAAQGDLILQLDADEIVDEDLSNFIKKIHADFLSKKYKLTNTEPVAWWIPRKNFFLGSFLSKGGQYPDPVIRLFLKGRASLPQKDVHEQMVVVGKIGWAEGHLLHYSNPSLSDYLRKFNTYTSFKAAQLKSSKTKVSLVNSFKYLVIFPSVTFLSLYFRHKGFVDGLPGFLFAAFSGFHHSVAYIKLWESYQEKKSL